MTDSNEKICPRCHEMKLKSWNELSDEEKFLTKSLALSAKYTREERKRHMFCTLCWFEDPQKRTTLA